MDIISIHVCVHFGLCSSDNFLLNVNAIVYRILHSESKRDWGGIRMLLCRFEDSVKEICEGFPVLWKYVLGYFQAKAVSMVADGTAPVVAQSDNGASYEPALNKDELSMASILTI
jgi:hypothetical protein